MVGELANDCEHCGPRSPIPEEVGGGCIVGCGGGIADQPGGPGSGPPNDILVAPPLIGLSLGWWPPWYGLPKLFLEAHSDPDSIGVVDILSRTSCRP